MSGTGSGDQGRQQAQAGGQPPGRRDAGQQPDERGSRHAQYGDQPPGPGRQGEPDVLLDVPDLRVESIRLAVDALRADISLKARLANLVQLDAGVRVDLHGVELDITDVRAEVLLKVRLEEVSRILDRALTTIERNPQIIEMLAGAAGGVGDDVHRTAQQVTGSTERLDTVVDRLGREIGSISAQARYRGPEGAAEGGREQGGGGQGRPGGGQGQQPGGGRQAAGGGQAEQRQQGGGAPGGGQAEQARPGGAQGQPGGGPGQQPGGGGGRQPGGAGPGRPEPGAQGGGQGQPGGGEAGPSPTELAAQASEALRQAGRSVWEAIQSGVSQHRPR
ncbi:hypothetical protein Q3W71_20130 [Micromonospora sp. C28SCA-DRY-2]|uniref:hypothetical protein n=1 Tax=Micromonospora sp. C28SCA-DRY-2 TaxID=3059522 RepID=UPI0026767732|nr:hypothetical protein [Micromonospora sp. C28SCA-DRY-2]MDO3703980.1 hypothetical protein [Micromonospora sp. C28SCA-DRY-2]